MKKSILVSALVVCFLSISAQTALQFNGLDCYDNPVDLFSDLDAGKAVVLHYYMPDCGMCPPAAEKIQAMANHIMETYPGMIKGYAFPFQNSTDCDYSVSWVEDNDLPLYAPMDSGAAAVAYYGGFGMPTVVLLGGADHRVMFSTLSFVSSDTTEMADSILALFGAVATDIISFDPLRNLNVSPNPTNSEINLNVSTDASVEATVLITDLNGKCVFHSQEQFISGINQRRIDIQMLADGLYLIHVTTKNSTISTPLIVNK